MPGASDNRLAKSLLMACQTPPFGLGSLGKSGKASSNNAPITAVARTSELDAVSESADPGGLGDGAPARMPDCDERSALSYILGSVPTGDTGVSHMPFGKCLSS